MKYHYSYRYISLFLRYSWYEIFYNYAKVEFKYDNTKKKGKLEAKAKMLIFVKL